MRLSRNWTRAFKERELLLRADGQVRYLRLSRRRQLAWAVAALGLGLWLVGSSVGIWHMNATLTAVEREAAERAWQLSDDGHQALRKDLVEAETRLSELSAENSALRRRAEQSEQRLGAAQQEREASVTARARLEQGLAETQRQLADIAARKTALNERAEALEQRLSLADQDKEQLAAERTELAETLARTEERLADLAAKNAASARRSGELEQALALAEKDRATDAAARRQLEQIQAGHEERMAGLAAEKARLVTQVEELSRRQAFAERDKDALLAERTWLEQDLARAEAELAQVSADRAELELAVSDFEAGYALALATEPALTERVAALEGELAGALDRAERAESQRDFFETRAERLEDRLDGIAEVQNGLVQRLADTTLQGVGMIEKIVAMTGLNVNELILSLEPDTLVSDQGGPFLPEKPVPGDYGPGDFLPGPRGAEDPRTRRFLPVDYMSGDFMSGEMVDGDYLLEGDPDVEYQVSVFLLDQQMDRWEALQHVIRSIPLSSPLDQYRMSSGFGKRSDPVNNRNAMHMGLDLSAPMRTPVMATAPGRVTFAGWMGGHGRIIELDHGNGIRTRYAHLRKFLVKKGEEVELRQEIGLLGNSGRTTGPHVHYEILVNGTPHDPMKFLVAGRNAFKG
jgi:murein DD-endopeptidase MepM/ murein hydrolase activator NlpD